MAQFMEEREDGISLNGCNYNFPTMAAACLSANLFFLIQDTHYARVQRQNDVLTDLWSCYSKSAAAATTTTAHDFFGLGNFTYAQTSLTTI